MAYTSHVEDTDTDLVYMKARYYNPLLGRFMAIDPVSRSLKNTNDFNRYAYTANNPYSFTDPTGEEIVSRDPENNKRIEGWINSHAKGVFKFDKNNRLQMVRKSGGDDYSAYYRDRLIEGINSDKTITIGVGYAYTKRDGKTVLDVDGKYNGGVTSSYTDRDGNVSIVDITISNGANYVSQKDGKLKYTPADKLIHEMVGHAIPLVGGTDPYKNGIKNENIVRRERGMRQRDVVEHGSTTP